MSPHHIHVLTTSATIKQFHEDEVIFRAGQAAVHDNIDEHKPWDVIGIVEGTGTVTERIIEEVRIGDTSDKVKIERKHLTRANFDSMNKILDYVTRVPGYVP